MILFCFVSSMRFTKAETNWKLDGYVTVQHPSDAPDRPCSGRDRGLGHARADDYAHDRGPGGLPDSTQDTQDRHSSERTPAITIFPSTFSPCAPARRKQHRYEYEIVAVYQH